MKKLKRFAVSILSLAIFPQFSLMKSNQVAALPGKSFLFLPETHNQLEKDISLEEASSFYEKFSKSDNSEQVKTLWDYICVLSRIDEGCLKKIPDSEYHDLMELLKKMLLYLIRYDRGSLIFNVAIDRTLEKNVDFIEWKVQQLFERMFSAYRVFDVKLSFLSDDK